MKAFSYLGALLLWACTVLAIVPTLALARDVNAMASACRSDYQTFCAKVSPGGGRIAGCLKEHAAELSAPCKAQLGNMKQCSEQVKAVCGITLKPVPH